MRNINYATGVVVHHGDGTHTKYAACTICGYETNSDRTPDLGRHMRDHYRTHEQESDDE